MAGYLNQVQLIGNVGADPDINNLNNGGVVANFSIATTESWKDKNTGEKKERTEWHRIVVFSEGLVGVIEQFVRKGTKLFVQGELQTRKWEKDGVDHYSTEVVLTGFDAKLILLGGREGGNRDPNNNADRPGNKVGGSYADQSGGTARGGNRSEDRGKADFGQDRDNGGGSQGFDRGRGRDGAGRTMRDLDDEIPF